MAQRDPLKVIGASVERLEDLPLITGRAKFVGDISFPDQLHMRIVRSSHAHGEVISVDTSAAESVSGVVCVWTADDIADIPPIDFREGPIEHLAAFRQPVLARERVRYVGEPVAAVFATDEYIGEDAAALVTIEVEPRPALLAADAAPTEFALGLSTEATICRQEYGDIDEAFRNAHAQIELDLSIGRHSAVPLETRGAIGFYDGARDVLELHGAAKVPHRNRLSLARMLGISPSQIHLYESHVGGGFGVRGELYPEDVLVLLAARRLDRPVKWVEDRREHLMAANHSRQQRHKIRAAVDQDGRLLGIDDEFFHDQGAYIRTHGTRIADMTCGMLPGPYRLPAYRAVCHFRLTNKTPAATYRAPGRYESNFARERIMDAVAAKLGLSRTEVRRRNLILPAEMPYARPLVALGDDIILDSGDYPALLNLSLARIGGKALADELARRREAGELVGVGLAMFVEKSGLGPADTARVTVEPTGAVEVVTGGASLGQGFETVMAQICAETLGVDYRCIRVVHGRTDRIASGIGAHASRATVMTGNAVAVAAGNVRTKAINLAAELMQTKPQALQVIDGEVLPIDVDGGPSISLAELAQRLQPSSSSDECGLSAEGRFETEHQTYPYGCQIAVVSIDRGTYAVTVERLLVAYDVGRAVNPMLIQGQIMGGVAQGLGGALYEQFLYDEQGQPLSITFADYMLPTAAEVPEIDILLREDAPSTRNPLGIKGAGESGIAAAGAVIASAVEDAIGLAGAITELPITPQNLARIVENQHSPSPAAFT